MKNVFLTHNTALPSSAAVERQLCKHRGSPSTVKRNRLKDLLLEKLVLLKINHKMYINNIDV
jgi:hypothetical protein